MDKSLGVAAILCLLLAFASTSGSEACHLDWRSDVVRCR